jgi:hypothetical protein
LSRNKDRLGGHKPEHSDTPAQFNPLNFVAPTEFVELPSKGLAYPEGHSLHNKDTIEIRFMTAKDEDILSSRTLLKKGIALERFLENIIIDKSIDTKTLLIGDKNAILVSARASGYGFDYETVLKCPQCTKKTSLIFDLRNPKIVGDLATLNSEVVQKVSDGIYKTKMPLTNFEVQFRLMNGQDEMILSEFIRNMKAADEENFLTNQFKRLILSVEGHDNKEVIEQYVDQMPVVDSRHFKMCIKAATPNIEIRETFKCRSCAYEEEVDVPFGTDFFWPDR